MVNKRVHIGLEFRSPPAPIFIQKQLWVWLASLISIWKSSSGFQPKWPNFYSDSAMGFQNFLRISIWIGIWVPRVLSGVLVLLIPPLNVIPCVIPCSPAALTMDLFNCDLSGYTPHTPHSQGTTSFNPSTYLNTPILHINNHWIPSHKNLKTSEDFR